MQRQAGLDGLLGHEEPHATFHDAELLAIRIDYEKRELVARWRLCVGDPDAAEKANRERQREGVLTLQGLAFWCDEPAPAVDGNLEPPWLTADGPLSDAPTETGRELAMRLPADTSGWYLFFSDRNAFTYCAARLAGFQWV